MSNYITLGHLIQRRRGKMGQYTRPRALHTVTALKSSGCALSSSPGNSEVPVGWTCTHGVNYLWTRLSAEKMEQLLISTQTSRPIEGTQLAARSSDLFLSVTTHSLFKHESTAKKVVNGTKQYRLCYNRGSTP